eukprot:scaffold8580_cov286-Pinguiococcus_pyrenoidosus.AAC.3
MTRSRVHLRYRARLPVLVQARPFCSLERSERSRSLSRLPVASRSSVRWPQRSWSQRWSQRLGLARCAWIIEAQANAAKWADRRTGEPADALADGGTGGWRGESHLARSYTRAPASQPCPPGRGEGKASGIELRRMTSSKWIRSAFGLVRDDHGASQKVEHRHNPQTCDDLNGLVAHCGGQRQRDGGRLAVEEAELLPSARQSSFHHPRPCGARIYLLHRLRDAALQLHPSEGDRRAGVLLYHGQELGSVPLPQRPTENRMRRCVGYCCTGVEHVQAIHATRQAEEAVKRRQNRANEVLVLQQLRVRPSENVG